ncbi:UNVERIFIED_CONTAM: Phosphatidylinositol 4-kinase gamma 3 [Sesamum calycinum]|uniref:1-phosphatidylinositol 4-kinase n=1 Tax=Sesamum calycinum TaxID=2727403 RepID=A0AAW2LT18_9LAMI
MSVASVALSPVYEDYWNFPGRVSGQHGSWSNDSILIYLTVGGSVIPMRVLESDSIASVKLRIQKCKGFFVKKQKLVFDGKELARNNSRVRDYGVADGNVLHLVLRLSDLQAITVRTVCGKEFEFHVQRKRNVGYVKQQIAKRGHGFFNLKDQELFCDGEELEDQRIIDDLCRSNEAVIHFLVRKSAKLRAIPVEKDFEVSILASDVEDKGLERGYRPIRSSEGSGGAYFMQDSYGQNYVSVFKPIDEEPMAVNNPRGLPLSSDGEGLKRGTRFEDCTFEWLYWPQAREPFSSDIIAYINSLDADKDIELLKFHGWNVPHNCARVFRISTMLLKKGAERGFTPFAIGSIMCRETVKKESVIEKMVQEAQESVLPGTSESAFLESISIIMDRYLDGLST